MTHWKAISTVLAYRLSCSFTLSVPLISTKQYHCMLSFAIWLHSNYAVTCSLCLFMWEDASVYRTKVFFQRVRVPFKMELKQHAGLRGCWRPLFEFEWVKLLLEVVAFIRQRDHTAWSSIPRSSADWFASVLLCFGRVSNCIDWNKQIHLYVHY